MRIRKYDKDDAFAMIGGGSMIDHDALREELRDECCAAFYGGGIGPALMDALNVDDMSPEELVKTARMWGVDVDRFTI